MGISNIKDADYYGRLSEMGVERIGDIARQAGLDADEVDKIMGYAQGLRVNSIMFGEASERARALEKKRRKRAGLPVICRETDGFRTRHANGEVC
jgi:hypothetical protein